MKKSPKNWTFSAWLYIVLYSLFWNGGFDLKKNFKTTALVLLLVIITLSVLDNLKISDSVEELQENKQKLSNQIASLKIELGNSFSTSDELEKENKRLVENLTQLEEEVDSLKSVDYQEFMDAISTVESYKTAETLEEARQFMSIRVGTSTLDRAGTCPCSWLFDIRSFEWIPNTVIKLSEFTIEKEKILLTYNTIEDIERDYQFVMTKEEEGNTNVERWKIEKIKLKEKGN